MPKNYIKITLFLTFILKQYSSFHKIIHNSFIFYNNQLKLITPLYIVSVKTAK